MPVQLLNQSLHELYGWHGDPVATAQAALACDGGADAIVVRAYLIGLDLLSTGVPLRTATVRTDVAALRNAVTAKQSASASERDHVSAIEALAGGDLRAANAVWERRLVADPTDPIALRFLNDGLFFLGRAAEIKNVNTAVLPRWRDDDVLYSYVLGMTAFGYEEAGHYAQADAFASQALQRCRTDVWASHARAHVFEMEGRYSEGEEFLRGTEDNWRGATGLACHLRWHLCLYLIEMGRHHEALGVFDAHMASIATPSILDLVDMAALLFRLEMEGIEATEKRWQHVWTQWKPHLHDHLLGFNDAHIAMALLGASPVDVDVDAWLESTNAIEFALHGTGGHRLLADAVGRGVVRAVWQFKRQNYSDAVEILLPLRTDVHEIGGSNAQRDLFHQLLIQSCLRSGEPQYSHLARHLLTQREAIRPTSPLTKRLMSRLQQRAASEDE